MLNIQHVLETRYPRFFDQHATTARTLSRFLSFLFYESRFQQFGRDYPHLQGFDFVDATLRYFDFTLKLRDSERARIPTSGRVVIAANHPIGSLDGLALLNLVRQVRPDVKVVANDLLTAIDPLHPVLLPVNNMSGNTARQNLRNIRAHLEDDGALIIFPAGEVSRFGAKGVKDGEWQSGFVKIARATRSPVLPIFVAGRNSLFFYSLSFLARPLSTLWLVREMFKQSHNAVDARVGNPIPYDNYSSLDVSAKKLAQMFRKHVYRIARNRRPVFRSIETVAAPENRGLLRRELAQSERLGDTVDGKQIYLARMEQSPCVMREIGRLRELTFRAVGEGTGLPRDIDRYDRDYHHLVLWDAEDMEIAGAYRLGDAAALMARGGVDALYTHSLFDFGPNMRPYLEQGLELGRSFVQPRYQTRHSLDYLWYGIGAFVRRHPRFRYLFGPASISRLYGVDAIARIAWYYGTHYNHTALDIAPRTPFQIPEELKAQFAAEFSGIDRDEDFRALRDALAEKGLPVPVLYKHYSQATEPEGVTFTAFNVDHDFGDCVDGFVMADLEQLTPRKRKRYLAGG
ncbi:lysophospholipid acyltransferase family protein [Parahaliea mediterranea]|uniref:L-ornithine N(alpha)-acyltransferase n=1 Tax=Parahaliea mediterranea TaxID=651086 RepID=A0A939INC3_9GAMM|nr:lysophospholipid acyltransferase family protein [Parahaliea mediterranea]MBN7797973.1 lysophospholipid acyltransferase family protein [Parahaliea mediterranea]